MVEVRAELRSVWRIAWPVIITNVLNVVVGLVDLKMVGVLGVSEIAAVGMARQVMNLVFVIMIAISGGTSVVIARAFGANDHALVSSTASKALIYSAVVALALVMPVGILTRRAFLVALGGSPEVVELGSAYLGIIFAGALFTMFNFGVAAVLLGVGRTRVSLVLLLFVNGINIGFNYVFIFGLGPIPAMGIAGAGMGTLVARALGTVAGVWIVVTPRFPIQANLRRGFTFDSRLIGQIVRLGGPRSLQGIVRNFSRLLTIRIVTLLAGATAMVSAYSVAMQVRMISTFVGLAFMQAAAVRVSQNLGGGRVEDATRSGWIAAAMAAGCMSVAAVMMAVIPDQIMGFFTSDAEVIRLGRTFFIVVALSEPVMAFAFGIGGALRGGGDSISPFVYGSVSDLVVVAAAGYLFAITLGLGFTGVALALALSALTRAIPTMLKYRQGAWKSIQI